MYSAPQKVRDGRPTQGGTQGLGVTRLVAALLRRRVVCCVCRGCMLHAACLPFCTLPSSWLESERGGYIAAPIQFARECVWARG